MSFLYAELYSIMHFVKENIIQNLLETRFKIDIVKCVVKEGYKYFFREHFEW